MDLADFDNFERKRMSCLLVLLSGRGSAVRMNLPNPVPQETNSLHLLPPRRTTNRTIDL